MFLVRRTERTVRHCKERDATNSKGAALAIAVATDHARHALGLGIVERSRNVFGKVDQFEDTRESTYTYAVSRDMRTTALYIDMNCARTYRRLSALRRSSCQGTWEDGGGHLEVDGEGLLEAVGAPQGAQEEEMASLWAEDPSAVVHQSWTQRTQACPEEHPDMRI